MSETDSFINEVTEEVRRDRLFALMRRYGWIAITLVVLLVGGAAWIEWQKARDRAVAQSFGDAVLTALDADGPAARVAALAQMEPGGGQGALVGLIAAGEALAGEDRAAAAERLAAIAADESVPALYRSLASLKRVILVGDTMPALDRDAALAALATPGQPFRALAMEQQALAQMRGGDTDAAVATLRTILSEPQLTAGLRRRVTQLMVALGADPEEAA